MSREITIPKRSDKANLLIAKCQLRFDLKAKSKERFYVAILSPLYQKLAMNIINNIVVLHACIKYSCANVPYLNALLFFRNCV